MTRTEVIVNYAKNGVIGRAVVKLTRLSRVTAKQADAQWKALDAAAKRKRQAAQVAGYADAYGAADDEVAS